MANTALPQVSDLLALRALAENGTVSKASQRLGLSQPALSYALERMRKRFGDPLFVRVGNRMAPTPFAQQLQGPAARVLAILENEVAGLKRFDPATTRRRFNVVVNEIGAITFMPSLVRRLTVVAPYARLTPVQMAREGILDALVEGRVDILAGHYPGLDDGLHQQLLYERSYVCIARADHPTVGDRLGLHEFARAPLLASPMARNTMARLQARLKQHRLDMNITMVCQHLSAIPFIVSASDLIAIVPTELLNLFQPITRLKTVRLPFEIPPVDIHQYWHPRTGSDPAAQFLRELIFSVAQDQPKS